MPPSSILCRACILAAIAIQGFNIYYLWHGARRRYVPDSIVRLINGQALVIETKDQFGASLVFRRATQNGLPKEAVFTCTATRFTEPVI